MICESSGFWHKFKLIIGTVTREIMRCKSNTALRRLEKAFVLSGSDILEMIVYVYQCRMYILACQGINMLSLVVSETLSTTTSFFRSEAI